MGVEAGLPRRGTMARGHPRPSERPGRAVTAACLLFNSSRGAAGKRSGNEPPGTRGYRERASLRDGCESFHELRRLGVRIAIDDFGTGNSSISYLCRFSFDEIKIDRSFVRDVENQPEAAAIIRAIVGSGKSLNMTTLVEGVETDAQRIATAAEGAHGMQGFFFSPRRPAHEIDDPLRTGGMMSAA